MCRMKTRWIFALLLLVAGGLHAQKRCSTMQEDSLMRLMHKEMGSLEDFERFISEKIQAQTGKSISNDILTIPVVIHVIHNGEAVGTGSNISEAQAISQITVLNEDFGRFGAGFNNHPDGVDTRIRFCLAQRDPNGNPSNGIDRINRNTAGFTAPPYTNTTYINSTIKPATSWDPNRYCNFWCMNLGSSLLGYAQFPNSSGLTGFICNQGAANTDGVVVQFSSFGRINTTAPYNLGKTMTHEIGHWLGLRHIWGDATCGDDFCGDTPTHQTSNSGCPSHPKPNACGTADEMFENYMDYSHDACMNIFTRDQTTRMRTVLTSSPRRASLLNSDACLPPVAADAQVVQLLSPMLDYCQGASITPQVRIKNMGSATLTSLNIHFKLDNAAFQLQTFSGSVAAGGEFLVSLPAFTTSLGNHTYTVYTSLPNNQNDVNNLEDTLTNTFTLTSGQTLPFTENFESLAFPSANWSLSNNNNDCYTWRRQTGIIGSSGTSTGTAFNYHYQYTVTQSGETDDLISPLIDLSGANAQVSLYFDLAYARRSSSAFEDLTIEVSTDCGNTYSTLLYSKSGNGTGNSDLRTVSSDQPGDWKPLQGNAWRTEKISLASFIGSTIRLRFRVTNRNGNNIYLDNISVDDRNSVFFNQASSTFTESPLDGNIDCRRYRDIQIPVSIVAAPATNITIQVSALSISAYTPADFQLLSNTLLFPAGSNASQNISVRIFDDNSIENTEQFQLLLSDPNGLVTAPTGPHQVSINDNDNFPTAGASVTLINQNFESLSTGALSSGWTSRTTIGSANTWVIGENAGMNGSKSAYITNNATTLPFSYTVTSTMNTLLYSPVISTTGLGNLTLTFNFKCSGEVFSNTVYDFGALYYATTPTGALTTLYGPGESTNTFANGGIGLYNFPTLTGFSITLPEACNNLPALYLVWRWRNDNSDGTSPLAIDDVVLTGNPLPAIETDLNANASMYLGPFADNVYLSSAGKILARITNLTAHDYGCTSVSINRAGTNAAEYYSQGAGNFLASKTIQVQPTNNNPSGIYNLTLYLATAEANGYAAATGKTAGASALIYKSNGSISNINANTPFANGTTNTEVSTLPQRSTYPAGGIVIRGRFNSGFASSMGAGFGLGDCVNRIFTGTPTLATPCAGSNVTVPFQALGLFTTGNSFTAQLSNASGSFTAPVSLGTLAGTPNGYFSGTINGSIATSTATGTAYRIRVNASAPASPQMSDNGSDVGINATGSWLGSSSNWQTAANWCGGIPTATTNVSIPAGTPFLPQLNANASCNNLFLNGSNLRVNLNNYTLTMNGAISGTGRITGSASSSLIFNGSGSAGTLLMDPANAQTKSLLSLSLNKTAASGGLNLGDTLNLTDVLTLSNGTLSTGGFLKLISGSTQTARIAPVTGTGAISGTLISQRLAPGGKTGWATLGNPVNGASILQWQDDFPTSGFSGASGQTFPPFVSVYSYDETVSGTLGNGYIPPSSASEIPAPGKGYMVYLGNGAQTTTDILLDVSGTAVTGNFNFPVTYTSSLPSTIPDADGWNLVSNPYCSVIDWDSPAWTKTGISPFIYSFNADVGNYSVYQGGSGIGINGGSNLLASHQGFWVKANAANPLLTITESVKSAAQRVLLRQANAMTFPALKMHISGAKGSDECLVVLHDESSDSSLIVQAPRLPNAQSDAPALGISKSGEVCSIAHFSHLQETLVVPVFLQVKEDGNYTLLPQLFNLPETRIWLKDKKGQYNQPLVSGTPITIELFSDAETNRFWLEIPVPPQTSRSTLADQSLMLWPHPASDRVFIENLVNPHNYRIAIRDISGKLLKQESYRSQDGIDVSLLPSGMYLLELNELDRNSVRFLKLMIAR